MKLRLPTRSNAKIDKGNFVEMPKWRDIKVKIRGKNNKVIIPQDMQGKMNIFIKGDNNTVIIKSTSFLNFSLCVGTQDQPCCDAVFTIGKGTQINKATFLISEWNSFITIGDDCLFSTEIECWCSDTHSIYNQEGKIENIGKSIEIGDHVWIGKGCHISKNTKIPNGSVVGWNSNVTRKFEENNVIIAGNPAQIVKKNISWDTNRPQFSLAKEQKAD